MALYDPKQFPDADIVPAPVSDGFTVAEFLDWVRTKPADERYPYDDPDNCALCIFLRETLRAEAPSVAPHIGSSPGFWNDGSGERRPYPAEIEPALEDPISRDWTWGSLALRLKGLSE